MSFPVPEPCLTPPETPPRGEGAKKTVAVLKQNDEPPKLTESTSNTALLDTDALDQLNSKEAKSLLDTVDALRALHVGGIVQLPQIVVVGDQSSGKSSVLEAISRVRFPVKGGLCTRFATELVLRTAAQTTVDISIERRSDDLSTTLGEDKLKSLHKKEDIPEIVEEAKKRMGIDGSSKIFSPDVLRIKIFAPDVPNLTLVDLPGFYHSEDDDQSAQGQIIVNKLVRN